MLFNSFVFLIFLFVVLPVFYLLKPKGKKYFLVVASYIFYGYWDWRFTLLILLSTVIDYLVGAKIYSTQNERKRKNLLLISLASNLGILGFFKYFNFFTDTFAELSKWFGYNLDFLHLNVILPVGISFYTFQTLSYTIDIYRRKLEPANTFLDFALFVSFFPQLVAGPIERAANLLPQIQKIHNPDKEQVKSGIILITIGMFKKILIGDTCGRFVDPIFASPGSYSSLELFMGLFLFSMQVYNDFSGYSHIARGTAKLLGVELMKNFEQPLLSRSITEVWQRWHISLSSWLRDYLYIPLGGNRKGKIRTYYNLMITMLLGGLWHGASWTFVFWGFLHGLYLIIHRIMLKGRKVTSKFIWEIEKRNLHKLLGKIVFFNLIWLSTLLFFRADSFSKAFYIFVKFFDGSLGDFPLRLIKIMFAFAFVSFAIDLFELFTKKHDFLNLLKPPVRYAIVLVTWFYVLLYLFQAEPAPFIYFQF